MRCFRPKRIYGLRRRISTRNSMPISVLPSTRAPHQKTLNVQSSTPKSRTDFGKTGGGEIVFCNPPYGREIYDWVRKCYEEAQKPKTTVVMLIPARTDTCYFHKYIYRKAREIRFLKGRLKFGNQANSAPFPSMIVVF